MRRTILIGLVLAVAAGLLVDHGGHLGAAVPQLAELGAVLGAVLVLVPGGPLGWRAVGFGAGFLVAWGGYALRAGVLPDIPLGHALAVVLVVVVVTAVAAASVGRIPLWAGLLGAAAMVGGYETQYDLSPTTFRSDSATAATTVLLATAIGFAVTAAAAAAADWRRPARARVPIDLRDQPTVDRKPAPATVPDARADHNGEVRHAPAETDSGEG